MLSGAPTRKVSDILRFNMESKNMASREEDKIALTRKSLLDKRNNMRGGETNNSINGSRLGTHRNKSNEGNSTSRDKSKDSSMKLVSLPRKGAGDLTDRSQKKQSEQLNLPAINGVKKSTSTTTSTDKSGITNNNRVVNKEISQEWPSLMNNELIINSNLYQPTIEDMGKGTEWVM